MRCKSWVPVWSLRQGAARTSKAYRTLHKPYWALHSKSRVNYTTYFLGNQIENASKYCLCIAYVLLLHFFTVFSCQ